MMFWIGLTLLGLGFVMNMFCCIEDMPIGLIIGIILLGAGLFLMEKGITAAPETTEVVVEETSWEGGEVTC